MASAQRSLVESYYPGRIRVRLPRKHRSESALSEIKSLVEGVDGIRNVYTNVATGSVLVEYDPELVDAERMISLGHAGSMLIGAGEAILGAGEEGWLGPSVSATRVLERFKRFDWRLHRASGGIIDAKMAVPLILLAWSLGRAVFSENRSPTPWHALLWYSYSVFVQWNKPGNANDRVSAR